MSLRPPLLRPAFWLWLALAAWPPELIAWWQGWDLMAPAYVALMLIWWPMDTLGRLGALRVLLEDGPSLLPVPSALPVALSAEISVGLRSSALALLGLVPAAALVSLIGLESRERRWGLSLLALLGMVPALIFMLKRLLAPIAALRGEASSGPQALDASKRHLHGRTGVFLRAWLPWMALSWALDALSLGLPEAAALALAPLSLGLGLLGLRRAWSRLAEPALAIHRDSP